MNHVRGHSRDHDGWGAGDGHGANPGWSWAECLPDFLAHEDSHRAGGEWRVERQRLSWPILDAVAQAAQQAGIPASDDFNRGNNEGVDSFEVNRRSGRRWNAAHAFLRRARKRPNLTVWTGATVNRLLFRHEETEGSWDGSGLRVAGVELRRGGTLRRARARAEVVLAAGAIGSPAILQRSGVGAPELLRCHGLSVRHVLPGVGANLQDHLQIRAVFQVQGVKTLNVRADSLWGKAQIGLEHAFRRSGPLSMSPSQLGAFVKSEPQLAFPNLQVHVHTLALDASGQPLHRFPASTASVCNLNPTSRGVVEIRSADMDAVPSIAPRYLSTEADRRIAVESLRLTRRIAAQPALATFAPKEYKPGVQFQTDSELVRLVGDIGTTIFHPVGTAKMGPAADPAAVVDHRLRVHGVAGLRVADASVMPTITSGNTSAPTLMIAERAARWIAADMGEAA